MATKITFYKKNKHTTVGKHRGCPVYTDMNVYLNVPYLGELDKKFSSNGRAKYVVRKLTPLFYPLIIHTSSISILKYRIKGKREVITVMSNDIVEFCKIIYENKLSVPYIIDRRKGAMEDDKIPHR